MMGCWEGVGPWSCPRSARGTQAEDEYPGGSSHEGRIDRCPLHPMADRASTHDMPQPDYLGFPWDATAAVARSIARVSPK